jgi:hypothetical protein
MQHGISHQSDWQASQSDCVVTECSFFSNSQVTNEHAVRPSTRDVRALTCDGGGCPEAGPTSFWLCRRLARTSSREEVNQREDSGT